MFNSDRSDDIIKDNKLSLWAIVASDCEVRNTGSMSVPGRIRSLRRKRGLTVETLAAAVGIHKGHLSRIETGDKAPSLATLEAIARALEIGMAELFGEKADAGDVVVVRRKARVVTGDSKTYLIEALMPGSESRRLASYIVSPGRTFLEHDVPDHVGQEFLFILQGKIDVAVADQLVHLDAGDCISYDASFSHKLRRTSSSIAKVLVVLAKE
jgi:transcriptional regulator with XRE-family HTH domain